MNKHFIISKLSNSIQIYDKLYPPISNLRKNPSQCEAGTYYIIKSFHDHLKYHYSMHFVTKEYSRIFITKLNYYIIESYIIDEIINKLFL